MLDKSKMAIPMVYWKLFSFYIIYSTISVYIMMFIQKSSELNQQYTFLIENNCDKKWFALEILYEEFGFLRMREYYVIQHITLKTIPIAWEIIIQNRNTKKFISVNNVKLHKVLKMIKYVLLRVILINQVIFFF